MLAALPIDAHLDEIARHLDRRRAAVLVAPPGSGKTTRVPPAVVSRGRVLVLQPRRVAVRAVATRIAEERGWTIGGEVGWHIRQERRFAADTPLVVVTEGILTARLLHDPLLSDVTTVIVDEFHERSIHADVGLALARQAWLARDDLRLVVMSATLDADPVAAYLQDCPVVRVEGARHPLTVEYAPGDDVAAAARAVLDRTSAQVLCFLPGRREIDRAAEAVRGAVPAVDVVPLHGSLDGAAQDAAIRPSDRRRIILATNLAETSLTVPGVSAVIDTGLVKVPRYDAERGLDHLVLERVTRDSADQRAGRAARLGPGLVRRLWDARDVLRPHREPDIARVDLAGPVLDVLAWGGDPRTLAWFEAPPDDAVAAALALLRRLGAVDPAGAAWRVTALGRRMQRLPLPVRLARIAIEGRGAPDIAAACALLAEGRLGDGAAATTSCDLLAGLDAFARQPPAVRQLAREIERLAGGDAATPPAGELALRRALFSGYADRLARRRAGSPDRVLLASGHGAVLGRESGVRHGDFLIALDVTGGRRDGAAEARIRAASRVEAEWIAADAEETSHHLDDDGCVRATRVRRVGAVILSETPVAVDAQAAAALLAQAWLARTPSPDDTRLLRRLAFAGLDVDLPALVGDAAAGETRLDAIDVAAHLPPDVVRRLATLAPSTLPVPSGRAAALTYEADGTVTASVKLQELFGLAETPLLGPRRVPVTFRLLAPNGRPVQTTRDLRSFWRNTYPEVRSELRGRYPKHPWPEDPWTATPTHRTTRATGR